MCCVLYHINIASHFISMFDSHFHLFCKRKNISLSHTIAYLTITLYKYEDRDSDPNEKTKVPKQVI